MSTLFAGAATAAIVMGGALEFAKLVGASWLSRSWSTAFPPLRWAILAMVVALMGLNAMGCYGYLTRAHLQSQLAGQIEVDSRATPVAQQVENKTAILADLNRRIGQIDNAVEEATRRGRTKSAMDLAAQQTRARADLLTQRQVVASELADLRVRLAAIDALRQRVEAEVGPVRLPRRSGWASSCSFTQPYQPSPKGSSGRPAHRPFRGLLGVHSHYGLHTRAVTNS
jgi:hypothetical protein